MLADKYASLPSLAFTGTGSETSAKKSIIPGSPSVYTTPEWAVWFTSVLETTAKSATVVATLQHSPDGVTWVSAASDTITHTKGGTVSKFATIATPVGPYVRALGVRGGTATKDSTLATKVVGTAAVAIV